MPAFSKEKLGEFFERSTLEVEERERLGEEDREFLQRRVRGISSHPLFGMPLRSHAET
jgi:hypothetical protein